MTLKSLRRAFAWLAFAALSLNALVLHAAGEAPRRVASIEGVTEFRLDNGLRVLLVPAPATDTVTVHITYLVGARHEGYGEKGMAHLLEHMLFKGSPRHPDVKAEFQARGGRWNGTTSYDRTNYYETLSATDDNLDWALGMEADRMLNAHIRRSDLDSEMTVVRNEFEMGENNPGGVLHHRMRRLAFGWHNYGNSVIGARSDIEQVPIERLQAFYRAWYRPDNAVLIVAGRFGEARALELVAKHFGPLARPATAMPALYTVEPVQDGERSVTLRRAGDTQIVAAMYRVPAAVHPDYPAVDVLVRVLGNTPSGRLHKALVQSGLASWAWGAEAGQHDPGVMYFGAGLQKERPLEPARAALLGALEGVAATPVQDEEVARARTELLNEFDKSQADVAMFVRALSEFSALGDWRHYFLYRERLRKVSTDAVRRAAQTYLKPANRVLGVFVPTAAPDRAAIPATPDARAALEGLAGGAQIALGEAFDPTPANIEARVVRRTLANGIRLAMLPKATRGNRVVATLQLRWGDEASRMHRAVECSVAGGMLMRGTRKHGRGELKDAFERLNATVSVDAESASIEVRRDRLEETLALVAEILREPAFNPGEFDELRRASLTGAQAQRNDPSAIAGIRLARHLNPYPEGHPLHPLSLDERIAALENVTLARAKACHQDLIGATGAEVAMVGDFDPATAGALIERLFGDWKNPAPYARIPQRHFDTTPVRSIARTPDKANAVLRAGLSLPLRDDHPDFPALVLANYLLGGSSTARLPGRIREKDGLSYSTYTGFQAGAQDPAASFSISAIFAPQNRARIETAIREELERARREGFAREEFEAAKNGLLEARRLARSRDRTLAGRLAWYLQLGRTFDWDVRFEARIAALTAAQVQAALVRHIDPARLSSVIAGDFTD